MLIEGNKVEGKINKQKKNSLVGNLDGTVYFEEIEIYEKEPDYISTLLEGRGELILTTNDYAIEIKGELENLVISNLSIYGCEKGFWNRIKIIRYVWKWLKNNS